MRSFIAFSVVSAAMLFAASSAHAQAPNVKAMQSLLDKAEEEYRTYFKRPESTVDLWAAIKFEIDVGKFDLAALHLKRLLANDKQKPEQIDDDLFKIEGAEGMNSFLRLMRVQRWSEFPPFQKEAEGNVKLFFEKVNSAVDKRLGDAERINKFIKALDADTVEERAYAFTQLNRSRERAVPYLVEKLQENSGKPLFHRIVEAMVNLDPETVPAYLEVMKARNEKDAQDQELRLTLLRILRARGDKRVVPYLWHLSASPMYPPLIRETALKTLAEFLKVDKDVLPPPKLALVELSQKYFNHQMKLPDRMKLYRWDGLKISTDPVELKAGDAEEFFALRHALEAIELDPAYVPAQLAYLAMSLERTILHEYEQAILKPLPSATQRLLATLDADVILRLQERAYEENNLPILLATIRSLGDRGELRAAKPSAFGAPQGVVRGLYHPDRRVQYQAVNALLKMPTQNAPAAASRTVDALLRLVTVDLPPAALVVGASFEKSAEVSDAVRKAGFEAVDVRTIQDALKLGRGLGNVEAIVLHHGLTQRELPYALTQLRGDIDYGMTPVLVIAPADSMADFQRIAARYKNVAVLPEVIVASPEEIKKRVDDLAIKAGVALLTPDERKAIASRSLDILHQMARGQIAGYDVRPVFENVGRALGSENAPLAIEILGKLPGTAPQMKLADVVLDPAKEKFRVAAAHELNRHVQQNGLMLVKNQVDKLKAVYLAKETDVALRTELSYLIGGLRTTATRDGVRIYEFRPDPAEAPGAAPPPEKKE